jgi:hypothetical protein
MGSVQRGFEYGYGAQFGRVSANASMALIAVGLSAFANRLVPHYTHLKVGGEILALMTVTQGGVFKGCYLYRVVGKGRNAKHEPLSGYDTRESGLAGLAQWANYLDNGGTFESWRTYHDSAATRRKAVADLRIITNRR